MPLMFWKARTTEPKGVHNPATYRAGAVFEAHREWIVGLPIVQAIDAMTEASLNRRDRHCRIGKITMRSMLAI